MEDLLIACARMIVRIRDASLAELDDLEGDLWDDIEGLADAVKAGLDYPIRCESAPSASRSPVRRQLPRG